MLKQLETFKEFDILSFLPTKGKNRVKIQASKYNENEESIDVGISAPSWHIVLFRKGRDSRYIHETFDGVLLDPRVYVSRMVSAGWWGCVIRKTEKSKERLLDFYNGVMKTCEEYNKDLTTDEQCVKM